MNTKTITILSIAAIFLILIAQGIIFFNYYNSLKLSLKKEVNIVLEESFLKDLNKRNLSMPKIPSDSVVSLKLPESLKKKKNKDIVAFYNLDEIKSDKNDIMGSFQKMMNSYVSKTIPLNVDSIAKIAKQHLIRRDIKTKFEIEIINLRTKRTIKTSNEELYISLFKIQSSLLPLDFENNKALRLTLINPFATLFKTMGGLLVTSLFLSLFCFFGLWFLFRTLAKQKELTTLKDDFFGHIAHEIKRPVNHLVMAIDALSKNNTDTNPAFKSQCLSISKNAIDEISEKMKMIMALSMAEEGVFQLHYSEFDINQVIQGLIDKFSLFSNKRVMFSVVTPPSPIMVKGDKEHLSQCFANLIDNAIKYSNERVSIEIKLEIVDSEILLSVRDNGIGIAPQKLNKIFEKYSRLHRDKQSITGYGIGLNYVKTIVEKHTGRISVASEEQKGSEFQLWIPRLV